MTLDAFVEGAISRELDRLALEEHDRATARPARPDAMWEIVIPQPLPR